MWLKLTIKCQTFTSPLISEDSVIHQRELHSRTPCWVLILKIHASLFTLQLGLGDLPTGFSSCDSGGTGRIHERSLQHARPVLLARRQIALPPSLEVVLAFSCDAQ